MSHSFAYYLCNVFEYFVGIDFTIRARNHSRLNCVLQAFRIFISFIIQSDRLESYVLINKTCIHSIQSHNLTVCSWFFHTHTHTHVSLVPFRSLFRTRNIYGWRWEPPPPETGQHRQHNKKMPLLFCLWFTITSRNTISPCVFSQSNMVADKNWITWWKYRRPFTILPLATWTTI